jgi:Ion channel
MNRHRPKFESDEDLAQAVIGVGPCTYLLLALIGLIIIYPYCKDGGIFGRAILASLYSFVLVGGTYATSRTRNSLIVGITLAALGVGLQWTALLTGEAVFLRLAGMVFLVFLILAIAMVLRYLLMKGPVTADKLHGALAGYIMIALFWAFIYSLMESFHPGSFNLVQRSVTPADLFFQFLYFSFTTLTTVGYGDITPATDQARSLVMVEQMGGVFFVAVLIARLAGLYPPRTNQQ